MSLDTQLAVLYLRKYLRTLFKRRDIGEPVMVEVDELVGLIERLSQQEDL